MARVEVDREWSAAGEGDGAVQTVAKRHGLKVEARGDAWELEGGSQLRCGYSVAGSSIPARCQSADS